MSMSSHEAYLIAHPFFYDTPVRAATSRDLWLQRCALPPGWTRRPQGLWTVVAPETAARLPDAGWKLHVAATESDGDRVGEVVAEVCFATGVTFKYLSSLAVLRSSNSKYASRATSGKYVAVYPPEDQVCEIADELHRRLAHAKGPRILTDLRWLDGVVHARHGAFRAIPYAGADGSVTSLVRNPDGGFERDVRRPGRTHPGWARVPDGFRQCVPERTSGGRFSAYRDVQAMHFSNGGGVYSAVRAEDGLPVVIKEGRPHAGLDGLGLSAYTRLGRERDALSLAAGVPGVARLVEMFDFQGHRFLVQERLPGNPAYLWMAQTHPLVTHGAPELPVVTDYVEKAGAIYRSIVEIVDRLHAADVVHGDLHPGNVLIDGTAVHLIDFECATTRAGAAGQTGLRAAGFGSDSPDGVERDRWALDMLALWFLLPLNRVLGLDPTRLAEHLAFVRAKVGVGEAFEQALERLAESAAEPARTPLSTAALVSGVRASATPARDDQLYRGAPAQFSVGGATFGSGAAGVLWALQQGGHEIPPDHRAWFADAASSGASLAGLWDGRAGLALVANRLGMRDAALALLDGPEPIEPTAEPANLSLYSGAAGRALVMLEIAAQDGREELLDRAVALGLRCRAQLEHPRLHTPGLLHGWSGVALLMVHLARATGERAWLADARQALLHDVASCVRLPHGAGMQVKAGVRRLAYLGSGSAGIGLVIDEYLQECRDEELGALLPVIADACRPEIVVQPGLIAGRAGLLATLVRLRQRLGHGYDAAIRSGVRSLELYRLHHDGHVHLPGEHTLRASADLAHGAAGVVLALDHMIQGDGFLPFFGPRPAVRAVLGEAQNADDHTRRRSEHELSREV